MNFVLNENSTRFLEVKHKYFLKLLVLHSAKYLGLFAVARLLTRQGLRILCYHGFSLEDEHLFRPQLFMTEKTFKQRLEKIAEMGFVVVSLENSLQALKHGEILKNSLVITLDDGWKSTEDIAAPWLAKFHFPWTLYLTTYYAEKQTLLMNVAIQYLLWKTKKNHLRIHFLDVDTEEEFYFSTGAEKDALSDLLILHGDQMLTAEDRQAFVRKLAELLEVDLTRVEERRMLHSLPMSSVEKMHRAGVDIQMHTHRHSLGDGSKGKIASEIEDNRRIIASVCQHHPVHFCYPSGSYRRKDFVHLSECGVESATTCRAGLNFKSVNPLELNRFLDGENISQIEFESELCGFSELLRQIRKKFVNVEKS